MAGPFSEKRRFNCDNPVEADRLGIRLVETDLQHRSEILRHSSNRRAVRLFTNRSAQCSSRHCHLFGLNSP